MKLLFKISVFVLLSFHCLAQDHFLVELEKRSPDVDALVRGYEGFPSIPVMANDIMGVEQNLMAYKAEEKNVILFFWKLDCQKCIEQFDALNQLQEKYQEDLKIISFADDAKEGILNQINATPVNFPIVPNSKTLADGPYGGDLGYPRIFVIDEFGVIRWVFPEVQIRSGFDTYNILETLHVQLKK